MNRSIFRTSALAIVLALNCLGHQTALGDDTQSSAGPDRAAAPASPALTAVSPEYVLRPGDVVQIKVYQEEDLTALSRIGKDGSITMPLLGSVKVASNTVDHAAMLIRDLLAKDYLVNPQVTLNVSEFAKRRFTVLGQVQRPGTYDMPADEAVSLLQAIATAGGYTRIGNPRKVTVQRVVGTENKVLHLDAEGMAQDKKQTTFEIHPDDVIVVGEKWI